MLYLGIFFSIANGAIQPTYGLVIMQIVKVFNPALTNEKRVDMMMEAVPLMAGLAVGAFFCSYAGYALMQIASERLSFQLRARYLSALMKQEVAYFERQVIEALPSKLAESFTHIAEGSGEKFG